MHDDGDRELHDAFVETVAPPEDEPESAVAGRARPVVESTLPGLSIDDAGPGEAQTAAGIAFVGPQRGALLHQYELIRELGRGGIPPPATARPSSDAKSAQPAQGRPEHKPQIHRHIRAAPAGDDLEPVRPILGIAREHREVLLVDIQPVEYRVRQRPQRDPIPGCARDAGATHIGIGNQ